MNNYKNYALDNQHKCCQLERKAQCESWEFYQEQQLLQRGREDGQYMCDFGKRGVHCNQGPIFTEGCCWPYEVIRCYW